MSQTPFRRDSLAFHAGFQPDVVACIDLANGEQLTYQQFEKRVSECASRLVERLGAPAGKRVATLARNSADQAIVAIATERCGAIFAPLNWRLTPTEIAPLL